ncbi:MAG: hypothetical protein OHK0013_12380 [Sandaracinaceae bacterium]
MRGRLWIALAWAVAGCGSEAREGANPSAPPSAEGPSSPAQGSAEPTPAREPGSTVPSPEIAALRAQAETLPFRWFESVPEQGVSSRFGAVGTGPRLPDQALSEPGVYVADLDGSLVYRAEGGAERWRASGAAWRASPTVAAHVSAEGLRTILVSGLADDGWRVDARDGVDGASRWTSAGSLRADDGVLGSPAVQTGVVGDLLAIYLRSREADRTIVLRATDGLPLAVVPVHPEVSHVPREPDATAVASGTLPEGARVRCGATTPAECTLERPGAPPIRWTSHAPRACRTHVIVAEGDDVIIADHCASASGVEVHGATASTGALRFSTRPYGVGEVAHSRWSNEVRLLVTERWIRVWGLESGLRYVSTLDRATGRELATITGR